MREMPGTFQHVLISANSSSEAPQLWWAGGWLSGKEQTQANIETTDTDTNCECHLAFAGPRGGAGPSEGYAKEWVVTGVGEGQGRREGANDGGKQECVYNCRPIGLCLPATYC